MNISRRVCSCVVGLALLARMCGVSSAAAQQPGFCLDNSGAWSVPAGATYEDTGGTWICAPDASAATGGGWLRKPRPAPAIPTDVPAPEPRPVPPRSPSGSQVVFLLPLLVSALGMLGAGAAVVAVRRVPRLHGHVLIIDKQRTTRVDLARFRRVATVGTSGMLRLAGDGVLPQHAELRAEPDGHGAIDVVVRPKQGGVSLLRSKHIVHVAIGTPLRDRDEIVLGVARLQYRDLAAGVSKLAG